MSRPQVRRSRSTLVAQPAMIAMALKRLRQEPRVFVLIAIVCASSLILASIPRFLNTVSDAGIQRAVNDAPVHQSGFSIEMEGRIGSSATGDSFDNLGERGRAYRNALSPSLQQIVSDDGWIVDSPRLQPVNGDYQPLYRSLLQYPTLQIRYQNDVWEHVTLVEGRMPQRRDVLRASEALGFTLVDDSPRPVFEIVLTAASAEWLRVSVGDRLLTAVQPGQQMASGPPVSMLWYTGGIIEVVGLIEINDPADPYWFGDPRLHYPNISWMGEVVLSEVYALAAIDEAVYADLYRRTQLSTFQPVFWTYTWRYYVSGDLLTAQYLDQLARDLRNLETTYGPSDLLFDRPHRTAVRTGLSGIVRAFTEQQRVFSTVLALSVVTLLALIIALVGLLAALFMERRRASILLQRGRGASGAQLIAGQVTEGLLLAIPAALLGFVLALLLVNARSSDLSFPVAIVVGLGTTLLLILALLRLVRPPLGVLLRQTTTLGRSSPQRLVIEGAVVVIAIVALVLLRRRGITEGTDADARALFAVDPYLAAAPVLISLAASLVLLRGFPLSARFLSRVSQRMRGIVGFVALRRVSRQTAIGGLPLVVMTLAIAMSVFTLILQQSIDRGQADRAWQAVGADYRLQSNAGILSITAADVRDIPGVSLVAEGAVVRTDRLIFVALDTAAYQQVTDGTAASTDLPQALLTPPGDGPIPALVAQSWLNRVRLRPGDTFEADVGRARFQIIIQEERRSFPGRPSEEPFIIVPYERLAAAMGGAGEPLAPTLLFVRADGSSDARLRTLPSLQSGGVEIVSRSEVYQQNRDMPLSRGLRQSFLLTTILAATFAAAAAITALTLSARTRARDLGFLRTLGLTMRQAIWMSILEFVPLAILAGASGALLGVAIAWLVEPGISLYVFTGGTADTVVPLSIVWWQIALLSTVVTTLVLVAVVGFAAATRRDHLGQVLRVGD